MITPLLRRSAPYIVVAISFAIVYACSLTFVYIEGDDAASVAFHALGRDPALQPPYSPYHGMMDLILGLLPAQEATVRYAAISISAISAVLAMVLMVRLISELIPGIDELHLSLISIFILLCVPEVFYLSMVYTPSVVAMSFVLAAHLLIRGGVRRLLESSIKYRQFIVVFAFSALLFGAGVACRWDIGVYLLFILADLSLGITVHAVSTQLVKVCMLWGAAAIISSIIAIAITGSGIYDIQFALNLARSEIVSRDSWFATVGAYQTFFTPAFGIFFAAGVGALVFNKRRLGFVVVLGILPVMPYLFSREPKMLLPAFPAFFLAIAAGVELIWFWRSNDLVRHWIRIPLAVVMLAPWLIGIQLNSSDTSWGPGFDARTIASDLVIGESAVTASDRVGDRTVSVGRLDIGLADGFAIPTPEGPRPVGGHAFVLFGGKWRQLAIKFDDERRVVAELAFSEGLTIVQDEGNSNLVTKLLEMGFVTTDGRVANSINGINQRRFFNKSGRSVDLLVLQVRKSLYEKDQIEEILKLSRGQRVILHSGYTSTLRRVFDTAPESVNPLAPFSAIVDLAGFHKALSKS